MATPLFGNTNYGPKQPSSQGAFGQQGANQTATPDISAQQYRAPSWTPAPGSSSSQPQRRSSLPQQQQQMNTGGSPVTPNGLIAPPQQPAASQPAAPAGQPNIAPGLTPFTQPSQPTTPDPFQGQGFWTGQQWVPKNHPLAQQGQAPTQPGQGGTAQPNPALYSPYGPYPGRPEGTVYQPGQAPQFNFGSYQTAQFNQQLPQSAYYQPGQLPSGQMPFYQAGTVDQFNAPNLSGLEGQQDALLQQVMQNPGLSPEIIAAMKERGKTQTLQMAQQLGQQAAQRGATTGMSGLAGADQRRIGSAALSDIMGGYREIDIAAADRARQDQLNALQASEGIAQGRGQRATNFYQAGLAGQMSQEELRRAQADSQQNATQFGLTQAMAQEQLRQAGADSAFRGSQFNAQQQGLQADENFRGWQSQFQPAQFAADQAARQEALNQQGAQSRLQNYQTDVDAFNTWRDDLARNRQLEIQQQLGQGGLNIDQQRLAQQGSQFDRSLQLDWAGLLNNMYMGRAGLGLNYAQLQQQGQNDMMSQILGLIPRG